MQAGKSLAGRTEFRLVDVVGEDASAQAKLSFTQLRGGGDPRALMQAAGIARIGPNVSDLEAGQELIWFPFPDCSA